MNEPEEELRRRDWVLGRRCLQSSGSEDDVTLALQGHVLSLFSPCQSVYHMLLYACLKGWLVVATWNGEASCSKDPIFPLQHPQAARCLVYGL